MALAHWRCWFVGAEQQTPVPWNCTVPWLSFWTPHAASLPIRTLDRIILRDDPCDPCESRGKSGRHGKMDQSTKSAIGHVIQSAAVDKRWTATIIRTEPGQHLRNQRIYICIYIYICIHKTFPYIYIIYILHKCIIDIPAVPHKVVAEVSKIGRYRRGEL